MTNNYKSTPFDELISDLMQHTLGNPAFPNAPSPIGRCVSGHLGYLRTIYLTFPYFSTIAQMRIEAKRNENLTPLQRNASMFDASFQTKFTYFSFIDALNQLGRQLEPLGFNFPNYTQIRFFRNKVVEHWDDYLAEKPDGGGSVGKAGGIRIPLIMGSARTEFARMEPARLALIKEFLNHGVSLDIQPEDYHEAYAQKVWPALKSIDENLALRCVVRSGVCDPRCSYCRLIDQLLDFEFPLPFYDVDQYISNLITELKPMIH